MGETNDLARQRLTRFLAARFDARQREAKDAQRAAPCSGASIPSRTDEKSSPIASDVDSNSRATP
jgi:hypothetical protein